MATSNITIRIDSELKKQAETLFEEMGLTITTAFTAFTKAAVREWKMPFELKGNAPSAETLEAMEDVRLNRNLHGPYKTAKEAVAAMLED